MGKKEKCVIQERWLYLGDNSFVVLGATVVCRLFFNQLILQQKF
jgi:hypothetical protein